MAALTTSLMGSGMSSQLATQLGEIIVSATGVGTVQGGSSPIARGGQVVLFTTAASNTAITLDSAIAVGDVVEVYTITATTALLYPPTGGTIDQGSANASVSIAQNKGRRVRRVSPTAFVSLLSA
jgi:hypothetical protein